MLFRSNRCVPDVSYTGLQGIDLGNSGDATELAWARTNVTNGTQLVAMNPQKVDIGAATWTADADIDVLLVKMATLYYVRLHVAQGTVLNKADFGAGQNNFSHVARFMCAPNALE